jgi:membrane-bound metal-dependent hydrolase YbcI (DUF457 family)
VGGVFVLFLAQAVLPLPPNSRVSVPLVFFLGGIFPDLDTQSIPSKWAARVGAIASAILVYKSQAPQAALIGIIFMLTKCGNHRGWTHSLALPLAISLAGWYLKLPLYALTFSAGLILHVSLDWAYSSIKKAAHK